MASPQKVTKRNYAAPSSGSTPTTTNETLSQTFQSGQSCSATVYDPPARVVEGRPILLVMLRKRIESCLSVEKINSNRLWNRRGTKHFVCHLWRLSTLLPATETGDRSCSPANLLPPSRRHPCQRHWNRRTSSRQWVPTRTDWGCRGGRSSRWGCNRVTNDPRTDHEQIFCSQFFARFYSTHTYGIAPRR